MITNFATDTDLLHWEPNILRDAVIASQTLLSGTGDLSGTSFSIASGSFQDAHVQPDQVISLGAPILGCFPIIKIDSSSALTISVLYDGLYPQQGERIATPVDTLSDVPFSIRTFWPQRDIVSQMLLQAAGVDDPQTILNPGALRGPCTLGTLQMIYNALAATASEPADFSIRADLYERLYRRALRSTRLEIDSNSDGSVDHIRELNVLELKRA